MYASGYVFVSQNGIDKQEHMSLVMRKPAFCICENKDADQLRGNRVADLRLCFRYTNSTIPLLPISEISSLYPSSVTVQPGLCRTWSETPVFSRRGSYYKTSILTHRILVRGLTFKNLGSRGIALSVAKQRR